MKTKKSNSSTTIIILCVLLIGLASLYVYLKQDSGPAIETSDVADTSSLTITDTLQTSIDTNGKNRVSIDISDPVSPADPLGEPFPVEEIEPVIKNNTPADSTKPVFNVVENMPAYVDGEKALFEFINKNIVYPPIDVENGLEGSVYIGFIVETDGSLSNFEILKTFSKSAGNEAMRVIKLTKWTAGKQNNKPVRVNMRVPVRFRLG